MVKVALAGAAGAFGRKHLDALQQIENVDLTCLIGVAGDGTEDFARDHGVPAFENSLTDALKRDDVEAVVLATPTPIHAEQTLEVLAAGKHVLCEIPMADSLADSQKVVEAHAKSGLVGMCGHVRRFNPSHQYVHNKITAGELNIQQMDVQTFFFRRTNMNALGVPRSWADNLLWHHSAHTIDLFMYQTGEPISDVVALAGPKHPELGIFMDMTIGLKTPTGKLLTLSLSFNNDGPLGTYFRYICDKGTYIARYDDLVNGKEEPVDLSGVAVSNNGIELINREFLSAIEEGRTPNGSFEQILPTMEVMHKIEQQIGS